MRHVPRARARRRCLVCDERFWTDNYPIPWGQGYTYAGICPSCLGKEVR